MKKQLLVSSALFAAIGVYAQNGRVKPHPTSKINMAEKIAQKFNLIESTPTNVGNKTPQPYLNTPILQAEAAATAASSGTWIPISTSRNIFGVIVSSSKPLQYNSSVNAISFIHRVGPYYTAAPTDNSGAMIADISTNWGATWDSTCFWSDGTNLARYPQGGIYSAPGNTDIANAYIVGSGPVTGSSSWSGSWYASKQLGSANYNNTASTAPNAMQYFPFTGPYTQVAKHAFPRYSFSSTADGKIRTIGELSGDPTSTSNTGRALRGATLVKGTFNAGTFTWSSDTMVPATIMRTDGTKQLYSQPLMAWSQDGVTGYVILIGGAASPTIGANQGWLPIVFKTTNSGSSWAQLPGIDFTVPTFTNILDHVASVSGNTAVTIPQCNLGEGVDAVVDANGKLHFVTTFASTYSSNQDSIDYSSGFNNGINETYNWAHIPGFRPYLYDFMTDGTGPWTYALVDSLSSEGPSSSSSGNGYNSNPWDPDPSNSNSKVTSDCRIQASRTADGKYIIYSWAESDTNFTNQQVKWNTIPDIKARLMDVTGTGGLGAYAVTPSKVNVSKLGNNPNVTTRAMFHYMSSVSSSLTVGTNATKSSTITVPFTVSNSNPYAQLSANTHWFVAANLEFNLTTGVKENALSSVNNSVVYPNPAKNNAVLSIDLKDNANVSINVYNTVGQLVKTIKAEGTLGANNINIDLNNISSGIYMVNVKVGNASSTKKLIVE